jgi:hypothetical protein
VHTLTLPTTCPKPCNMSFSAFSMSLYLTVRGVWPDLAMESQEFGHWVQTSGFIMAFFCTKVFLKHRTLCIGEWVVVLSLSLFARSLVKFNIVKSNL